jgi:hypothetical protein
VADEHRRGTIAGGNGHGGDGAAGLCPAARADTAPASDGSGRRFVLAAGFVVAAFSLALFVAFRQWKARHEELADYGARRVAPMVQPLADRVPPGQAPADWARVVAQGHGLLVGLTASGALDREQMRRLGDEVQLRVDIARPATSAEILNTLWTDLEARAGPTLTRAPRFELAAAVAPLAKIEPPKIAAADWALAVVQTRAMLTALGDPRPLPSAERRALRDRIAERLAGTTPETAARDLRAVWDLVADEHPLPADFPRPKLTPAEPKGRPDG